MFHLLFPIALLSFFLGKDTQKWVVDKNSCLSVGGRTNINRFCCHVDGYAEPDTICFMQAGGRTGCVGLHGSIRVAIDDFACNNRVMTSEFRKALRHREYPVLTIGFLSLERMPAACDGQGMKGWVEISLSGAVRRFEIDYHAGAANDSCVVLTGSRALAFSDFGLQPPQKMGGLVRVDDGLRVEFTLCLRKL